MNILALVGAGEPEHSSAKSLIYGFRELGHEVFTVGPAYGGRAEANAILPSRPHVEYYTHEEVLEKSPWSSCDLLINIEPGAFLSGPKPPKLKTALVTTDAHRAGDLYRRVLQQASFNHFFCGQKYYLPLYEGIGETSIHYLPVAFDPRRFQNLNIPAEVPIVFCGQSGLALQDHHYDRQDEIGRYVSKLTDKLPGDHRKYLFSNQPSYDYAPRAEMLWQLSQVFETRIYEQLYDGRYGMALQKGVIGLHRSLLQDVAIRCYEVMAAGRLLVADRVPEMDRWFGTYAALYDSYYQPFYVNFSFAMGHLVKKIKKLLNDEYEMITLPKLAQSYVFEHHTWKHRAESIINTVMT